MTEAQVVAWLWQNWPSLVVTGLMSASYLKLRSYHDRLAKVEHTARRIQKLCAKQHEDHRLTFLDDEDQK